MDELLGVMRVYDLGKAHRFRCDSGLIFSAAARNHHFRWLISASYSMENDVFLQHPVLTEGGLARFKNVEPMDLHAFKEIVTK